jgi:LysM repeat protein
LGTVALAALVTFGGCLATTKHVEMVEADVTRNSAWNDERIQSLQSDLEAVRAENETLRIRVDDLSDQIATLGAEVSARLLELAESDERTADELRRAAAQATESSEELLERRDEDRRELMDRMNVILDEVVKENSRLAERLRRLEESAFTFGRMHTVRPGETIASIAQEYNVTPEQIVAANDLSDANLIRVGQELLIPQVAP